MTDTKNYHHKAAEACIRFAAVLDEINSIKPLIGKALAKCEKPFEVVHGPCDVEDQTHLGRYFQNGGRLPADSWAGYEPVEDLGSDISECEPCMEAYRLCIERKKLRQKRGHALRLVRYYGRKAREATNA